MSDSLLVQTNGGGLRLARADVLNKSLQDADVGRKKADDVDPRTIEDVVDLSVGVKAAQALLSEKDPKLLAQRLAESEKSIREMAQKFGTLLGRQAHDLFGTFNTATRAVVLEILSGPHPGLKTLGGERPEDFNTRLTAFLNPKTNKDG